MLQWLVRSIVSAAIVATWQPAAAQSNSAELFKDKTIKLVVSTFVWIGQMANMQRLFVVWESSKIRKFEDLTTYDSIAGNTGKGSETFTNPAIINHLVSDSFPTVPSRA